MNIQKKIDELIRETAKRYNKPYDVVLRAWASQFKLLRETMKEKSGKTVKLPNWGKYILSPGKMAKIEAKKEAFKNEETNGTQDN